MATGSGSPLTEQRLAKLPYVDDDGDEDDDHAVDNDDRKSKLDENEKPPDDESPCRPYVSATTQAARRLVGFLRPFLVASVYSAIGAYIFILCERDNDLVEKRSALDARNAARSKLLYDMHRVMHSVHPQRADEEIRLAIRRYDRSMGIDDGGDEATGDAVETDWTVASAVLFAATIYTTIGYGNIACVTRAGRLATIFYACFGIPLMISVLNDLGNILLALVKDGTNGVKWAMLRVGYFIRRRLKRIRRFQKSTRPSSYRKATNDDRLRDDVQMIAVLDSAGEVQILVDSSEAGTSTEDDEEFDASQSQPPVLVSFAFTIGWLFLCAGLFLLWEEWTYFDSFYFFFVSLSTIGFGDLTPKYPEYTILTFPLVLIGLALVSVCFNVINEELELFYMGILRSLLEEYKTSVSGEEKVEDDKKPGGFYSLLDSLKKIVANKVLLPLMSKDTKEALMAKFAEEAKAQGIELPAAFTQLDPDSGMPTFMSVDKDNLREWIEEQHQEQERTMAGNSQASQTDGQAESMDAECQAEIGRVLNEEMNDVECEARPELSEKNVGVVEEWLEDEEHPRDNTILFSDAEIQAKPSTSEASSTTAADAVQTQCEQPIDLCASYFEMYSSSNQTDLKLTKGEPRSPNAMVDIGVQTGILARVQNMMAPGKSGAPGPSGNVKSFDSQAKREIEEARKRKAESRGGDEPKSFMDLLTMYDKRKGGPKK